MSTNRRGRRSRRGSILLLAIFFLIVLFSLSVAFFRIIPAEFHSASHSRRGVQANYAADAGVRNAVAWLHNQPSHIIPESSINDYNTNNFGSASADFDVNDWPTLDADDAKLDAHRLDEAWSFLSRIRLDDTDYFRRIYVIESAAYFYGRPVSVTKTTVQNESFAKFALMLDQWGSDFIFTMQPNGIQGPVHTNGFFRISPGSASFWTATKGDGSPQDAWVSGPLAQMTHADSFDADGAPGVPNTLGIDGDGVQYANGNSFTSNLALVPFTATGAPIADRYSKIVEGGREKIRQVQEIPMPAENTELRAKAWGGALPTTNAQWNTLVDEANSTVLVNTSTGKPNDPTGTVSGGIFIKGMDHNDNNSASDVLLDITPEGHQKTRIRQGWTSVEDPTLNTYWADVPAYHRPVVHDAWDEPTSVCTETSTRMVDDYHSVHHSEERTEANASRCGTHQEFIPGEGGISTPINVPNVCTFTVEWDTWEPTGTQHEETYCSAWGPGTPIHHDAWTEWVSCDSTHPDAQANGTTSIQIDESELASYPDYEVVEGERTIENWNSVVEVNDAEYHIPFHTGMKINGEVIPNASDSRLTVADGHTVTIKNDYTQSGTSYADYTVMEGRINGIVFSDANLRGVRGTNKGSKYEDSLGNLRYQGRVMATNIAADRNIEIRDSVLQYYDGTDPTLNDGHNRLVVGKTSPNSDHIMGFIGAKVDIRPSESGGLRTSYYNNGQTATRETGFNGGGFTGGINVYGIIMAGRLNGGTSSGGFGAHNNAMQNGDGLGDFNLYGGIISALARKTQSNVGGSNHGFRLGLNYDPIAAEYLENFPVTNTYAVLRYVTYTPDPN